VRDKDVAVLAWDMHDARPDVNCLPWPVHGVNFGDGVVLVDNALLEPLAAACAEERRYEFMHGTATQGATRNRESGQSGGVVLKRIASRRDRA
jgi:hypothetical protein